MNMLNFSTSTKILMITVLCTFIGCGEPGSRESINQQGSKFQLIREMKSSKDSPFYVNFNDYSALKPDVKKQLPVGVFDSGTGGLTVLDSILRMDRFNNSSHESGRDGIPDFEREHFVYLGDSANMPYGRYDGEGKSDFLRELILKDVGFLLGKRYYQSPGQSEPCLDKEPAKAIVIACNTATAFGLQTVQRAINYWGIDTRILGIIDAGARSAVSALSLSDDHEAHIIGVMATEGTCTSKGYVNSIKRIYKKQFHSNNIAVVQQAGFGLAAAIDKDIDYIDPEAENPRADTDYHGPGLGHTRYSINPDLWQEYRFDVTRNHALLIGKDETGNMTEIQLNSVENYIRYHVTHLVVKAAKNHPNRQLSAVILGCTHYPFYEKEIKAHFLYLKQLNNTYNRLISHNLVLVDPSQSLATELYVYLSRQNLLKPDRRYKPLNQFFVSIPNPDLKQNRINNQGDFIFSYKYGRQINSGLMFVKRVPFSREWMKLDVLERIKSKMPEIYKMLGVIQ